MNKDWTGNQNSIFKALGASNHTDKERQGDDYYATDPIAIDVLLKDGHAKISNMVWEPACGEGHLAERLKKYGYSVYSTDIVDRGYGDGLLNFLTYAGKVFMFLKIQFLEGKERRKLFEKHPPKYVYVSSGRILCAKNAEFEKMKKGGGSAVAYAWFEWEKGFNGYPTVKWIN